MADYDSDHREIIGQLTYEGFQLKRSDDYKESSLAEFSIYRKGSNKTSPLSSKDTSLVISVIQDITGGEYGEGKDAWLTSSRSRGTSLFLNMNPTWMQ